MKINETFLLNYVSRLKETLCGRYVSHPEFVTEYSFFFSISGKQEDSLAIILDQQFPRIYISKIKRQSAQSETAFSSKIRRELNNSFVKDIKIMNSDMIVCFELEVINNVFKEELRYLYVELIPHHPNAALCDQNNKILAVFRPMSLTSKRPLAVNMTYECPPKPECEISDTPISFDEYENYCNSLEQDIFVSRKKEKFGDHIKSLNRRLKAAQKKEKAIQNDIKKAETHLHDSEKANIIYTCWNDIKPNSTKIEYEGVIVELDPSVSLSENAQRYFKSEKKAKATINNAKANLERARKEIDQLQSTLYLFSNGDDAKLSQWVRDNKQKKKSRNVNALSSKELPYKVSYQGTTYMFGKNGVQNRYLTFFLSHSKNHVWLHIEGEHGSHLLIQKDNPSEEEINLASEMIVYLSSREDGAVQIANRGDLRQGNSLGEVILRNYRVKRVSKVSKLAKELVDSATKL